MLSLLESVAVMYLAGCSWSSVTAGSDSSRYIAFFSFSESNCGIRFIFSLGKFPVEQARDRVTTLRDRRDPSSGNKIALIAHAACGTVLSTQLMSFVFFRLVTHKIRSTM